MIDINEKALEAAARALTGDDPLQWKTSLHMARTAILFYLDAERLQGRAMMPREPDNDMWNAADDINPTLAYLKHGIATLGDDVFYEVIPGPSKIWMAMFDAYCGEEQER